MTSSPGLAIRTKTPRPDCGASEQELNPRERATSPFVLSPDSWERVAEGRVGVGGWRLNT
ncbi:hypothetical protein [Tautonia rosea]|uniref:hypothetical protein n=1 Tax=Tautonia rosea TaxID=2728037 RepID=UPI00147626E8|nr:hypothetical protein [Tautonia rosea]